MPFIIKNGKYYGSSGNDSVDITQEEYEKLEAEGKVNASITYYVTDGVCNEGGGNANIVKLTQAEYDALSDEKLSNNTIYLITDSGELTAENLFFDDTETGLGVNNVQDAIVEQNKNIKSLITTKTVQYDFTHDSVKGQPEYISITPPSLDGYVLFSADIEGSTYASTCMYQFANRYTVLQGISQIASCKDDVTVRYYFIREDCFFTS